MDIFNYHLPWTEKRVKAIPSYIWEQLFSPVVGVTQDQSLTIINLMVLLRQKLNLNTDLSTFRKRAEVASWYNEYARSIFNIDGLEKLLENNQVDIETTPSKLQNYYLFNPEEDGDLKFKLLLTRNDKNTLFNILNGISLEENHSLRVKENYDYFSKLITKDNAVDLYNGLMRLFVVDVALEKDKDNPQLIFESLNSNCIEKYLSPTDKTNTYHN